MAPTVADSMRAIVLQPKLWGGGGDAIIFDPIGVSCTNRQTTIYRAPPGPPAMFKGGGAEGRERGKNKGNRPQTHS